VALSTLPDQREELLMWEGYRTTIPLPTEEIRRYSSQYSARLSAHPNDLTVNLGVLRSQRDGSLWP
jgi:hypothetical protein